MIIAKKGSLCGKILVMKARDIYEKFKVPPNLQEHLIRVTKVALFMADRWQEPGLNIDLLKKACLLHDLGNLVKFKLKEWPESLGKEQSRLDYWLRVQAEMVDKYGPNDHQATMAMLEEAGVDEKVREIVLAKSFGNVLAIQKFGGWELKILFYADLRTGPFGVMPLKERLDEVIKRSDKYRDRQDLDKLIEAAAEIEKELEAKLDKPVSTITEESIGRGNNEFLEVEI
jgi:hypothetical protein